MHWYNQDGEPDHNQPFNVAKALWLRPSVTGVLDIMAKPGLEIWKQNQILDAAMHDPYEGVEQPAVWKQRIRHTANQVSGKTAGLGTRIHRFLEEVQSNQLPTEPELQPYVAPLLDRFASKGVIFEETEQTFVCNTSGYGGTIDAIVTPSSGAWHGVLDYKTTGKDTPGQMKAYNEHKLQLAAYAGARFPIEELDRVKLINVFISSTKPGVYKIVVHEESTRMLFDQFLRILGLWKWINQYDPVAQTPLPE